MTQNNSRTGSLITGAILIGLGALFLLAQFVDFAGWRYLWPIAVIAVGGLFFAGMAAGGRSAAGLAIPGSILTTIGLMLLIQNLTQGWSSWAYGWTLIIASIGGGLYLMGWRTENPELRRRGRRLAGIGVVLFVIIGALSELGGLFFGARGAAQLIFPVLLIGLGVYLIVRRTGLWPAAPAAQPAPPPEPPAAPEPPQNS